MNDDQCEALIVHVEALVELLRTVERQRAAIRIMNKALAAHPCKWTNQAIENARKEIGWEPRDE